MPTSSCDIFLSFLTSVRRLPKVIDFNETRKENEKIQPIKIRQSVIANLLKKENDTRLVQVFSGHRRASTTQQYKQTELEALQNAVNQYHPRK
ncbi:tyrosine-type recombinase/integrase [Chryseobacterium lathyri]|uniref:tyrosine-type recombinase/integrase n=1 Tax=Chryseobacterium lathyri TaxID=395933 RepID=UPI0027D80C15|nr:tyrosine-type recombinase/integrase [Chryseobacterium lathyri]